MKLCENKIQDVKTYTSLRCFGIVFIKINVAQNLGIISLIATSIFVHMCCKKKKKINYLIKNEKMKLKKYFMIESIKILQFLYKPFFSLFSLIKHIEVNIIKIWVVNRLVIRGS